MQNAVADGYTLAQVPNLPVFRLPYTQKIDWDPSKDLQYVIGLAGYAFGLVVPAGLRRSNPCRITSPTRKAKPRKTELRHPAADHAAPDG